MSNKGYREHPIKSQFLRRKSDMNPRLKKSTKWTAFPKDFSQQIHDIFSKNFKQQLENHKLIVEGRIYPEEILLRVGFLQQGRLTQINFEISMDYSKKNQDAIDRIHNCIDAVATLMSDYFQDEEIEYPRVWQEYDFDQQKIYFQFTTVNSDLEAQADALLGSAVDDLVKIEQEEDEPTHENDDSLKDRSKKNLH